MNEVATGADVILATRREGAFNEPEAVPEDWVYHLPIPPLKAGLERAEAASPELNQSGFKQPGYPAGITGPVDLGVALTADNCLEWYENIYGDCVKETLEPGVFQYTFTRLRLGSNTSLAVLLSRPPVDRQRGTGIKANQIVSTFSNNTLVPSRVAGMQSHGTRLSPPIAAAENTGTYGLPDVRGPLSAPRAGEVVFKKITRDTGGGGIQWKIDRVPSRTLTGTITIAEGATAVAGTGTAFTDELAVGDYLLAGVEWHKVATVTDDDTAALTSAHEAGVTAATATVASPQFPGAAISIAYTSAGRARWKPVEISYQLTGLLTVVDETNDVTGEGTLFTTELEAGQYLYLGGQNHQIESIESDTALTLVDNHTAGATDAYGHVLLAEAGYWDVNRDPLDSIIPGTATDHADLDIGDVYLWTVDWEDPVPTFLGGQRMTDAHLSAAYRDVDAEDWIEDELPLQTATLTLSCPTTPDVGDGSRHIKALDRDQPFTAILALTRKYRDRIFESLSETRKRIALRLSLLGEKLGTGTYRNSIVHTIASAFLTAAPTQAISNAGPIIETANLAAEVAANGDAPVSTVVITSRDWTPKTA